MQKLIKIIGIIFILYISISALFFSYSLYQTVEQKAAESLYDYTRSKLCYDCAKGNRAGVCPKINKDESLAGYVKGVNAFYPNATEYSGQLPYIYGGLSLDKKRQLETKEINEDLIIRNDYCYYRDWTANADYLTGFTKPIDKKAAYLETLAKPNFYIAIIINPLFIASCLITDCSM